MATIMEKNKMISDSAWLVLLELKFKDTVLYFVRNTENITWDNKIWQAFPFELEDIKEDTKGEVPSLKLRVGNQTRQVQKYIRAVAGGLGCYAIIRVVNSKHLDVYEPDLELEFIVEEAESDENWVSFTLGGENTNAMRYPRRRIIKDFCPFAFKGIECGYSGSATSCQKTLFACRALGNSVRFGGEYSTPMNGLYASNR